MSMRDNIKRHIQINNLRKEQKNAGQSSKQNTEDKQPPKA